MNSSTVNRSVTSGSLKRWSVKRTAPLKDSESTSNSKSRCGNINPVQKDDLIHLISGEKIKLKNWIGYPKIPKEIGDYRIQLTYSNNPKTKWQGLSNHDKKTLRKIQKTDEIELVSNEVIYSITE